MPIDPSIALQFHPPESAVNPLTSISQLMAVKSGMAEIALRQQQVQQSQQQAQLIQAETQQKQRDLADQNTFQEAIKDPAVSARVHTGDFSDLEGKIQPKSLDSIRASQLAYQNQLLTQSKEKNALVADTIDKKIQPTLNGLYDMRKPDGTLDVDRVNDALPGAVQQLSQQGAFKDANLPEPTVTHITSEDDLDRVSSALRGTAAAHAHVAGLQKEQAATKESVAKGEADTAQARLNNLKANLIQNGAKPGTIETAADALADPAKFPEANNAMRVAGKLAAASGDPEKIAQAMMAVHEKMVVPNLPATIAGKAAASEAEAKATAPIHQAESLAVAAANRTATEGFQSYNQAKADLDKQATPIEQTAQKIANIKERIANGTPQDWANIPAMVLSLTAGGQGSGLRMNNAVIDRELGGAGGWAKLQGQFEHWNPDTAKASDIGPIQQAQFKSVVASIDKQVQARLDVVNGARASLDSSGNDVGVHRAIATGLHQKLSQLDQQAGQPSAVARKIGDHVMYQGKDHTITGITPEGKLTLSP